MLTFSRNLKSWIWICFAIREIFWRNSLRKLISNHSRIIKNVRLFGNRPKLPNVPKKIPLKFLCTENLRKLLYFPKNPSSLKKSFFREFSPNFWGFVFVWNYPFSQVVDSTVSTVWWAVKKIKLITGRCILAFKGKVLNSTVFTTKCFVSWLNLKLGLIPMTPLKG